MLLVKTYIKPSVIDGIGLFANEHIKKDTVIWRFHPGFDLLIPAEAFEKLPEIGREAIIHNMYFSKDQNMHILMPDNARFFNHSDTPNTLTVSDDHGQLEKMTIAARDILPDEEITCNYKEFDLDYIAKNI